MYINAITSENTEDTHKEVITSQIPMQLEQIGEGENVDAIKYHFKWVLANDFYKDELTSEQIYDMEAHLPLDYQADYVDLPE